MTNPRPLLLILAAVLVGGVAHASEFSLGGAHLLAESSAQSSVDVTMNFTDRGRALRETAEGGDTTPQHNAHPLRGADVATPDTSSDSHTATPATPSPKSTEPATSTTDSPHGVSISPPTAIKRPSYRWQSLVPGTIK
jgi:hypothetical protein